MCGGKETSYNLRSKSIVLNCKSRRLLKYLRSHRRKHVHCVSNVIIIYSLYCSSVIVLEDLQACPVLLQGGGKGETVTKSFHIVVFLAHYCICRLYNQFFCLLLVYISCKCDFHGEGRHVSNVKVSELLIKVI